MSVCFNDKSPTFNSNKTDLRKRYSRKTAQIFTTNHYKSLRPITQNESCSRVKSKTCPND